MEGGLDSVDIVASPSVKLVYFAVLLLLLLVIAYYLKPKGAEGLIGRSLASGLSQAATSGATLRRLGTEFSNPAQGEVDTVYLPDMRELAGRERLVGNRETPAFWETNDVLSDYNAGQTPGMMSDAKSDPNGYLDSVGGPTKSSEHMNNRSVAEEVSEMKLRNMLY